MFNFLLNKKYLDEKLWIQTCILIIFHWWTCKSSFDFISWKIRPNANVLLNIWSIKILGNFPVIIVEYSSSFMKTHLDNCKWTLFVVDKIWRVNEHCRDVWRELSSKRDVCKQKVHGVDDESMVITKNNPSLLIKKRREDWKIID